MSKRICIRCQERPVFDQPNRPGQSKICAECFLRAMHDLMDEAGALDELFAALYADPAGAPGEGKEAA